MLAALRVTRSRENSMPEIMAGDPETLLVRVAQRRDHDAFKELFSHYGPRIKSLIIRGGANAAQAEDLVQDVMMVVWRKAYLFAPERGSASAWIFTIARNTRIDRLRRGAAQVFEDVHEMDLVSDKEGSDDEVAARQRATLIGEAVDKLPKDQRQIIELAFGQDMSQTEIGAVLSLPLGTVKSRMRLAYSKLRSRLEELK